MHFQIQILAFAFFLCYIGVYGQFETFLTYPDTEKK